MKKKTKKTNKKKKNHEKFGGALMCFVEALAASKIILHR